MMIKAIVFDLGKVVFDLSFDRVFQYWAHATGANVNSIRSDFKFDDYFESFERNEITSDTFRERVTSSLKLNISKSDFEKGWCDLYLDIYPEIDNLLTSLKLKYRLIAITNTNVIHSPVWELKYKDTLSHFEKVFSSHVLGTRKPEQKIYQTALDYLNLNANQTLFLDDNLQNIDGAKRMGMATVWVETYEQMKDELTQMRIL